MHSENNAKPEKEERNPSLSEISSVNYLPSNQPSEPNIQSTDNNITEKFTADSKEEKLKLKVISKWQNLVQAKKKPAKEGVVKKENEKIEFLAKKLGQYELSLKKIIVALERIHNKNTNNEEKGKKKRQSFLTRQKSLTTIFEDKSLASNFKS